MSAARPVALAQAPVPGLAFELPGDEAHHLARVLRVQAGDNLRLFFDGRQWTGEVVAVAGGTVTALAREELTAVELLPVELWFCVPALKGGHTEDLLRHLTEAGAAGFVLMDCQRAVSRHDRKKLDRLERILVEATKQCGRAAVPQLVAEEPGVAGQSGANGVPLGAILSTHLAQVPEGFVLPVAGFFALEQASGSPPLSMALAEWLAGLPGWTGPGGFEFADSTQQPVDLRPPPVVLVATGPEGGWTPQEVAAAADAGWRTVTLGPLTLRAETAPLIACGAALAAMRAA